MKKCSNQQDPTVSLIHRRLLNLMLGYGAQYTSPGFMVTNNQCESIGVIGIILGNPHQLGKQAIDNCLCALVSALIDHQPHGK